MSDGSADAPIHVCRRVTLPTKTMFANGDVGVECSCTWKSGPIHPSAYHWVVFVHRSSK